MIQLFSLLAFLLFTYSSAEQTALNISASPITRDQIMQRAQVWVDEHKFGSIKKSHILKPQPKTVIVRIALDMFHIAGRHLHQVADM